MSTFIVVDNFDTSKARKDPLDDSGYVWRNVPRYKIVIIAKALVH